MTMFDRLMKAGAALVVMPAQPRLQPQVVPPLAAHERVVFKCVGPTGLTVTGPVTGRRYRFERPGALLAVDVRDRAALAAVMYLRLESAESQHLQARRAA
jgi:hypothetical protein